MLKRLLTLIIRYHLFVSYLSFMLVKIHNKQNLPVWVGHCLKSLLPPIFQWQTYGTKKTPILP
jgi:hypothetical protein